MSLNLKKFKFISWEFSRLGWKRNTPEDTKIKTLKTWNRRSYPTYPNNLRNVIIHKGSRWAIVKLGRVRSAYKLGVFSFTKKPFYSPLTKKNRKK